MMFFGALFGSSLTLQVSPLPPGWAPLGCMSIATLPVVLDTSTTNTPASCLAKCRAEGHQHAGVTNSTCLCAAGSPGFARVPEENCNLRCEADTAQSCGGWAGSSSLSYRLVSVATTTSTSSSSSSSYCVAPISLPAQLGYSSSRTPLSCIADCKAAGHSVAGVVGGLLPLWFLPPSPPPRGGGGGVQHALWGGLLPPVWGGGQAKAQCLPGHR